MDESTSKKPPLKQNPSKPASGQTKAYQRREAFQSKTAFVATQECHVVTDKTQLQPVTVVSDITIRQILYPTFVPVRAAFKALRVRSCDMSDATNDERLQKRRRVAVAPRFPFPRSVPPFSRLPPDVVVSHILPHIVIVFHEFRDSDFRQRVFLQNGRFGFIRIIRSLRKRNCRQSDLVCFGRFVRDVFRHPWFIFRSLLFSQPTPALFRLVAVDSLKLITLTFHGTDFPMKGPIVQNPSLPSIPFPKCLPLLESLALHHVGWLESLSRRASFPSLRSVFFSPLLVRSRNPLFPTELFTYLRTEDNDASQTLSMEETVSGDSVDDGKRLLNSSVRKLDLQWLQDFAVAQRIVDSLPYPDSLLSLSVSFFPKFLSRFSSLTSLSIRTTDKAVCDLSAERHLSFSFLRKIRISLNPNAESSIPNLVTWTLPSLRFLELTPGNGIEQLLRGWENTIADSLVGLVAMETEEIGPSAVVLHSTSKRWICLESIHVDIDPTAFLSSGDFPVLSSLTVRLANRAALALLECDFPNLSVLSVHGTIDAEFFSNRHSFVHLKSLNVESVRFVRPRRLDFVWASLPSIQSLKLDLSYSTEGSDEGDCLKEFVTQAVFPCSAPCIRKLRVSESRSLTSRVIPIESLTALESVELCCWTGSDEYLARLSPYVSVLKLIDSPSLTGNLDVVFARLTMITCVNLSELCDHFFQMTSSFPCLEEMVILNSPQLRGEDWCVFSKLKSLTMKHLERLCLFSLFENDSATAFPSLKKLYVYQCGKKARHGPRKAIPPEWKLPKGCLVSVVDSGAGISSISKIRFTMM